MNRPLAAILLLVAASSLSLAQEHAPAAPVPAAADPTINTGTIGKRIAAAKPGDTITVTAGVYAEHLRIDKPLKLIGEGRPIIDGHGSGDIIEITAPDVTLKGFSIRNTGIDLDKENAALRVLAPRATIDDNTFDDILFGIDLRDAPDCLITNNSIGGKDLDIARRGDGLRLWRADRTRIEKNTIHNGRDAILWYSTGVVVRDNTAHDSRYGFHLMYSDSVTIERNTLTRNSVGLYIMYSAGITIAGNHMDLNRGPSGYGIGLKEADQYTITDNLLTGNRVGVYIDGSPFTKAKPGMFTRNTLACNDIGFTFLPSAKGNVLTENNFIDNIDQVSVSGRGGTGGLDANRFWSGEKGNFWSDYTGYDKDHNGVGDFVHESQTLFENMMDKTPSLRLFLFSPAQQAVEFVGRAVPAVRPEAKFTDEVPLMKPVPVAGVGTPNTHGSMWPLLGTGAGLVSVGLLLTASARRRAFSPSPREGARGGFVSRVPADTNASSPSNQPTPNPSLREGNRSKSCCQPGGVS